MRVQRAGRLSGPDQRERCIAPGAGQSDPEDPPRSCWTLDT